MSHVFALAQQSIGKETDSIEENEFIGEERPPDYGVELHSYRRNHTPSGIVMSGCIWTSDNCGRRVTHR